MGSTALAAAKSYQSEEELAAELGVAVSTLRRWHSERRGPPRTTLPGRKFGYDTLLKAAWIQLNAAKVTRSAR
jgi:hypothetical protein